MNVVAGTVHADGPGSPWAAAGWYGVPGHSRHRGAPPPRHLATRRAARLASARRLRGRSLGQSATNRDVVATPEIRLEQYFLERLERAFVHPAAHGDGHVGKRNSLMRSTACVGGPSVGRQTVALSRSPARRSQSPFGTSAATKQARRPIQWRGSRGAAQRARTRLPSRSHRGRSREPFPGRVHDQEADPPAVAHRTPGHHRGGFPRCPRRVGKRSGSDRADPPRRVRDTPSHRVRTRPVSPPGRGRPSRTNGSAGPAARDPRRSAAKPIELTCHNAVFTRRRSLHPAKPPTPDPPAVPRDPRAHRSAANRRPARRSNRRPRFASRPLPIRRPLPSVRRDRWQLSHATPASAARAEMVARPWRTTRLGSGMGSLVARATPATATRPTGASQRRRCRHPPTTTGAAATLFAARRLRPPCPSRPTRPRHCPGATRGRSPRVGKVSASRARVNQPAGPPRVRWLTKTAPAAG